MQTLTAVVACESKQIHRLLLSRFREWDMQVFSCVKYASFYLEIKKRQPQLIFIDDLFLNSHAYVLEKDLFSLQSTETAGVICLNQPEHEIAIASGINTSKFKILPVPFSANELFRMILQALQQSDDVPVWNSQIGPIKELNEKFSKLFSQIDRLQKMASTEISYH